MTCRTIEIATRWVEFRNAFSVSATIVTFRLQKLLSELHNLRSGLFARNESKCELKWSPRQNLFSNRCGIRLTHISDTHYTSNLCSLLSSHSLSLSSRFVVYLPVVISYKIVSETQ